MLTHSLDLRQCVNTWELSWLQRCHPFILERQVSLFSGQALAVCSQGGFQPLSSSLLPFTPSDILEPLFDGPCLYLNIAYFSVYLRMFSYVYFFQSVPCCRLHTQRQIGTQTHIVFFLFFSFKEITAGCRHPMVSLGVCHSQYWLAVFIRELYNVRVGAETHPCTPESASAWLDHCRGKRVAVWLQKQAYPGSGREEKVRCIPLWSDVRKYWDAAPEKVLKTRR